MIGRKEPARRPLWLSVIFDAQGEPALRKRRLARRNGIFSVWPCLHHNLLTRCRRTYQPPPPPPPKPPPEKPPPPKPDPPELLRGADAITLLACADITLRSLTNI
jgi:hypothetical protein